MSGAQEYKELAMSAKNEEKRQAELRKRQQYRRTASTASPRPRSEKPQDSTAQSRVQRNQSTRAFPHLPRQCYNCGSTDHFARDCKMQKTESSGRFDRPRKTAGSTKGICKKGDLPATPMGQPNMNPLTYLFLSDSEDDHHVRLIQINDHGSRPQCAKVSVQGVPMYGIVDSGAGIMILGGDLFRKVTGVASLKKKNFSKPDKTPRNYDQQPFSLDGVMDLEVTFGDRAMHTPVYIKMDAYNQLLLSEGVCRQLGIVSYHRNVEIWRGARKQKRKPAHQSNQQSQLSQVPSVRVRLVRMVRLPPRQSVIVNVRLEGDGGVGSAWLLEPDTLLEASTGLQVVDTLVEPTADGVAQLVLTNTNGYTQHCEQGVELCRGAAATVVEPLSARASTEVSSMARVLMSPLRPQDPLSTHLRDPRVSIHEAPQAPIPKTP